MIVRAAGQADTAQETPATAADPSGVFTRRNLAVAGLLFAGAMLLFVALAKLSHLPIKAGSPYSYFALQADAWLHLRWDITHPTSTIDLVRLHGKYYSIYGPFPALLLLPLVALFGRHVDDVLFCMAMSAANLSLLFLLFEQLRANGLTQRGWREHVLWSVGLYLGSTALFLSLTGGVWYTGHIVACTCLLVSLLLAFRRHFAWSALALGAAFLSRSPLLLGAPFLLYLTWQDGQTTPLVTPFVRALWVRRPDWTAVPWRRLGSVLGVLGGVLGAYLLRNWAMFGSPWESGYGLQWAQHYAFVTHGVLSPLYIPANLLNDFFNFPHLVFPTHYSDSPTLDMVSGATGTCVFLTSPLLLLLFWRNRQRSALRVALWGSVLLLLGSVLLFYTAGYPQFGTRYLFDLYPYAWVLLLLSDVRPVWRVVALGAFGVLINLLGTYQYWAAIPYFHLPQLPHF